MTNKLTAPIKSILRKFPFYPKLQAWRWKRKQWAGFKNDFSKFSSLSQKVSRQFPLSWENRYPCLDDNTPYTGFDRHYVLFNAWASRVIQETKPKKHIDIASSLYFCTMVSAFVPIEFYDYRPADLELSNLSSKQGDLMKLPFEDNTVGSLSCMHVIEHIGLGRYGDPLDPNGDLKAIKELCRVLTPKGDLLFVTPVGKPRIMFNAHRIYSFESIMDAFSDLSLHEFSLIPDDDKGGMLTRHADPQLVAQQNYGCGCFWFKKD